MFSRIPITKSTGIYSDEVKRLKEALTAADAVVIGAGAGLSTSAGFVYTGERFKEDFADFEAKYGFHDMYSGAFCNYDTPEAVCPDEIKGRSICINSDIGKVLRDLKPFQR